MYICHTQQQILKNEHIFVFFEFYFKMPRKNVCVFEDDVFNELHKELNARL